MRSYLVFIKGRNYKLKHCDTCNVFRSPTISHCRKCDVCIDKYDHHCPWLGNCIGSLNYRSFFLFLSAATLLSSFIIISTSYKLSQLNVLYDSAIQECSSYFDINFSFYGLYIFLLSASSLVRAFIYKF